MFRFVKNCTNKFKNFGKRFNSTLPETETYAKSLQFFHWFQGIAMTGLIASGYKASTMRGKLTEEEKELKGNLMGMHKSIGLLMLGALFPRIIFRLTTKIPKAPKGPLWERLAGTTSHIALYSGLVIMPITGVTFGYLSG